jgi:thiamine-monophosphate kinase
MIDLSDGLAADLRHLLEATGRRRRVGIEVDATALSSLEPIDSLAAAAGLRPLEAALGGSDDYELCFAVTPGENRDRLAREFHERYGLRLTRIGHVVERPGLWSVGGSGRKRRVKAASFEHFPG